MGGRRGRSRGGKKQQKQRKIEGNRVEEEEEVDYQILRGLLFEEYVEIEIQGWEKREG